MDEELALEVKNVYKDFKLPTERISSVKSFFTNFSKSKDKSFEIQHALKDISFEVKKGDFFGIVGRNGSGKSTLLKTIAGIYSPTKGSVKTVGKVVPFIELGVGFNPELSGKDNVYLNGAMLGFSEEEVTKKYNDIVSFAELDRFMGQKLKNYSSGMQVRLAFSVATILAESDILLLDEVLAVGDADFQRKCFDYFKKLKKQKKTVVFVSHDMNAIREYCDRAILIEDSKIVMDGTPEKVAQEYTKLFTDGAERNRKDSGTNRWGDEKIIITDIKVEKDKLKDSDNELVIKIEIMAKENIDDPICGFLIKNAAGAHILGTNSNIVGKPIGKIKSGEKVKIEWVIPNIFNDGLHYVDPAIVYNGGTVVSDWWEEATNFTSYRDRKTPYIVNPNISFKVDNT